MEKTADAIIENVENLTEVDYNVKCDLLKSVVLMAVVLGGGYYISKKVAERKVARKIKKNKEK